MSFFHKFSRENDDGAPYVFFVSHLTGVVFSFWMKKKDTKHCERLRERLIVAQSNGIEWKKKVVYTTQRHTYSMLFTVVYVILDEFRTIHTFKNSLLKHRSIHTHTNTHSFTQTYIFTWIHTCARALINRIQQSSNEEKEKRKKNGSLCWLCTCGQKCALNRERHLHTHIIYREGEIFFSLLR